MANMEINHFTHGHPLLLSEEKFSGVCCDPIFGVSYCCLVCPYVLHKYCADMPRELPPHKDHPDHPLVLQPSPKTTSVCKRCKWKISCSAYSCNDECSFNLHFYCALFPDPINLNLLGRNFKMSLDRKTFENQCSICLNSNFGVFLRHYDMIYRFYHIQCAKLPQVVKHDRHRHEFTLRPPLKEKEKYDEFICDLCEEERNPDDHVYYCEPCELVGHIGCGVSGLDRPVQDILSKPLYKLIQPKEVPEKPVTPKYQFGSYKDGETIEDGGDLQFVQTLYCSKEHPMVVINFTRTIRKSCARCNLFIFGMTYSCKECNYHIHKRCSELPKEIHHYRLGSLKQLLRKHIRCLICCRIEHSPFLFYGSEESDDDDNTYCIYCALLPDNLNHPSHEHVLTPVLVFPDYEENCEDEDFKYIRFNKGKLPVRRGNSFCQACGLLCQYVALTCESCNYFLHVFCSLLPQTGKHTRRRHELSLTYSYKEDPIALEFFCDTCEKPRIPNRWVYYCPDPKCVIVSHIECMDADIFSTYDLNPNCPQMFCPRWFDKYETKEHIFKPLLDRGLPTTEEVLPLEHEGLVGLF